MHLPGFESIACLTNDSTSISLYSDYESRHITTFFPNPEMHHENVKILDMCYSEAEGRIGAVMRDNTMGFWDTNDNFRFEKVIQIKNSY